MANTEIRLIIFFAAKDGEAPYSQQKQDWEQTVAVIVNSLLPNSELNWRKWGKPLEHSDMTYIKFLTIIQWKWEIDKGLDLINSVPDELWMEVHDIVQEAVIKTIPPKKKCKKAKWLSEELLQKLRKEEKLKAKEKRKDIRIWMQRSKE